MSMTVNPRTARRCCAGCSSDYGHAWGNSYRVSGPRTQLRRTIKRRERAEWKLEVEEELDMIREDNAIREKEDAMMLAFLMAAAGLS